jgi:hypothetical protein
MTSIILSNRINERTNFGMDDSIYKAWNFKNQLSSNIVIPANSQIALQSCKINVDGTYSLNLNGDLFAQWFGQVLSDTVKQYQTTSYPIQTGLTGVSANGGMGVNTEDLASMIQNSLNLSSHHPNHMGYWTVERKIDASTNEFKGFTYTLEEYNGNTDNKSTYAKSCFTKNQQLNNVPAVNWTYGIDAGTNNGEFTANSHQTYPAVAMLPELPMSLINGELIVDFSDANGKGVNWAVGLSRSNLGTPPTGTLNLNRVMGPKYWSRVRGGDWAFEFFCDYVIYRYDDELFIAHTITNPAETGGSATAGNKDSIYIADIDYSETSAIGFPYDINTNTDAYTKVKFTLINEQMKIEMLTATDVATEIYLYKDVGVDGRTKYMNLSPIHQANRCLHPVLYVETTPAITDANLSVEKCINAPLGPNSNITNNAGLDVYNAGDKADGLFTGWWEFCRGSGLTSRCMALERRAWNNYDPASTSTHNFLGLQNADLNLEGSPVIIVKPSLNYTLTGGCNTPELFGFLNKGVIDTFALGGGGDNDKFIVESTTVPALQNTRAIFVRLDNIPTKNINAFKGNNSTILSMLPRQSKETEVGRVFYEPQNLMYVDLLNEQEIRLNSFDVSFCYVDETFATNLSGQSVVVLHIKQKEHK